MKKNLYKAQEGAQVQRDQIIAQLQEAVSQGATVEQLLPQVLQMVQDPMQAKEILVQAGLPQNEVEAGITQMMEAQQQAQAQQSQAEPGSEEMPQADEGGIFGKRYGDVDWGQFWNERQDIPPSARPVMSRGRKEARQLKGAINERIKNDKVIGDVDYGQFSRVKTKDFIIDADPIPTFQTGGVAGEKDPTNPFLQMMVMGGKKDFQSMKNDMIKKYRKGGMTDEKAMDTSSTEGFISSLHNALKNKMFAGMAINQVQQDFGALQEANQQMMKYGGKVLPKAENGIVVDEFGKPTWDVETVLPFMKDQFGIQTMDDYWNLPTDTKLQVAEAANQYAFYGSDFGEAVMAAGKTYEDAVAMSEADLKTFADQAKNITARNEAFAADPNLEKKLKAYDKTYDEYLADPELKKEVDATGVNSNPRTGYFGTKKQQQQQEETTGGDPNQGQASSTTTSSSTEQNKTQRSLSGRSNLSTAEFLGTPLTDIIGGIGQATGAIGNKELTDEVQFKGFGDMKGMSQEEMAKAIESGQYNPQAIEDIYTRGDARRLAKGKTHRGPFGLGKEINPYGKRVFFDNTSMDNANNMEANPNANVDPNNPYVAPEAQPDAARRMQLQELGIAPEDMDDPALQMAVRKMGGMSPTELFQMALGGLIISEDQLKYNPPFLPMYVGGGVGGYNNEAESYIDFQPVFKRNIDFADLASGIYRTGAGVNELLEGVQRYVRPEERAANRSVHSIFQPKDQGSMVEGTYNPLTGQMMAQDTGADVLAGQAGDRAVRQRRGVVNEFARYGAEVALRKAQEGMETGQPVELNQDELKMLKAAGYTLKPR